MTKTYNDDLVVRRNVYDGVKVNLATATGEPRDPQRQSRLYRPETALLGEAVLAFALHGIFKYTLEKPWGGATHGAVAQA